MPLPTSMSNVEVIQCCFLRSRGRMGGWVRKQHTRTADWLCLQSPTTPYLQASIICVATQALKPGSSLV
jgi:hypothetical protein